MADEVKEEFLKLKKEDVAHLNNFHSVKTISGTLGAFKHRTVSTPSPTSSRFKQKGKINPDISPGNTLSTILGEFKSSQISSGRRGHDINAAFWAKNVSPKSTRISEKDKYKSYNSSYTESFVVKKGSNVITNKVLVFEKEVKAPKVTLTKNVLKTSPGKVVTNVEHHSEYKLRMPPHYRGSKMFMRTGEQVFWVRFLIYFFLKLESESERV